MRHTRGFEVRLNADVWLNNAAQLSEFLWLIPFLPLAVNVSVEDEEAAEVCDSAPSEI